MANKKYYLVIDTETTQPEKHQKSTVADFGALIVDRTGKVYNQCAVLIRGEYDTKELFYRKDLDSNEFWSRKGMEQRRENYENMLRDGTRTLASVPAVNRWIDSAKLHYKDLTLCAYNLQFDLTQCYNTGINVEFFSKNLCLWGASFGNFCKTKKYKQFCLDNTFLNPPTENGNATYKTTAEAVASFIHGEKIKEPHTAVEDCKIEACTILPAILKRKKWADNVVTFDWRKVQMKHNFKAI